MNRRTLFKNSLALVPALYIKKQWATPSQVQGPFQPEWTSLARYETPEWYKNAKFGIWAHWGPQCQPAFGDWYARNMYIQGSDQYEYHLKHYGHPSVFGFKDVIHTWKAENWNPQDLVGMYKEAGARYFVALANHHDNFDNYDSSFQEWNSLRYGPKKDLIGGWARAARSHALPFGVSVHASHAWRWYETAQQHDATGPQKGVPYDGTLTKQAGAGKWWRGLDPQELYEQRHPLSEDSADFAALVRQWSLGNGAVTPSKRYCEKFYKRTIELIHKYNPDLLYFDDNVLPLWPVSDVGLRIAAHFYNNSIKTHGSLRAVLNGKGLDEQQRQCMVWDIERGQANQILPATWQTDTCIGNWHYDQRVLDRHEYKTAKTVIHMLVDIVSKNGNLLLNVPVRGNGTIDDDEREIVKGITAWMKVNSESIYDTRPYSVFGEGPAMDNAAAPATQNFNEGKGKPFTAQDIRFSTKGSSLYATTLGIPAGETIIQTLKGKPITNVQLLGADTSLTWGNTQDGLRIAAPAIMPSDIALTFKIEGAISN